MNTIHLQIGSKKVAYTQIVLQTLYSTHDFTKLVSSNITLRYTEQRNNQEHVVKMIQKQQNSYKVRNVKFETIQGHTSTLSS